MVECCTITNSQLRVPVTLERRVRTPDGQGGWDETWVADPPGGVRAKVQNLSGTERWEAQRTESTNIMNLFIRFRGNAQGSSYWNASETRAVIRGRYYNVLAIQDLEMKKKWLRLLIQEGDPA